MKIDGIWQRDPEQPEILRPIRFSTSAIVLTDPNQRNEHLLGSDVLDYFALICDREANQVTLLRSPYRYSIHS